MNGGCNRACCTLSAVGIDFTALDSAPRIAAPPSFIATGRRRAPGGGRPPGKRGSRLERVAIADVPAGDLASMLDDIERKRTKTRSSLLSVPACGVVSRATLPARNWIAATPFQISIINKTLVVGQSEERGALQRVLSHYCFGADGCIASEVLLLLKQQTPLAHFQLMILARSTKTIDVRNLAPYPIMILARSTETIEYVDFLLHCQVPSSSIPRSLPKVLLPTPS